MTKNPVLTKFLLSSAGWLRGAALLCVCAALHCGEVPPSTELFEAPEPPAQLALSPSSAQMAQGTAQQFGVRGLYQDGRTRELTAQVNWTVADERGACAAMPADGYLQLENPGRYRVTASYRGRELTTTLVVTAATVKSVAISPRTPQVAKGLSQAFTAIATFSDATTQDVTRLATWSVKDVVGVGIATIDTTGILVAKSVGKATITARYMSHTSSTTMEVTAAAVTTLVVSPAAAVIARGTNQQFTALGTFSDGTTADVTLAAAWAVTDLTGSGVAAIDGTGIANGQAVGTAQVRADYSGLTGQTTLTVTPAAIVSISISPAGSSIAKGTTQRYLATATLTDGTTQDVTAMAAWTATDKLGTGVASIDGTGLAKGNAEGSSTISCTLRGSTAAALLTVTPAVLTGLTVDPAVATVGLTQYIALYAIGTYSDGSKQYLSTTAIWSESDLVGTNIASVDAGGRVLGKNLGQATITATSGAYSASAVVTVTPLLYTELYITPNVAVTASGLSVQFHAIATLLDGTTKDVSTLATWSVSNPAKAAVDSKGLVKALASSPAVGVKASLDGFAFSSRLIIPF